MDGVRLPHRKDVWAIIMLDKTRLLWPLTAGQRGRYVGAIVAILVSTAFLYAPPLIIRGALDHVVDSQPVVSHPLLAGLLQWLGGREAAGRLLLIAASAVAVATALAGVFSYLRGRWAAAAAEEITRRLRNRLYDHIQRLPCRWHDGTDRGDLLQRCTSDVETLRMFLANHVVEVCGAVVRLGAAAPVLFWLDARMAVLSMALMPPLVVFTLIFFIRIRTTFRAADESEGRMTSMIQENLSGIRVVRAFARQEHERRRFAAPNAEYRDRWYRVIHVMSWYWPLSDMLCVSQRGIVLIGGAWFVTRGQMSIGTLFAFIATVGLFIWPVQHLGRSLAELGKATVSLRRLWEVLSAAAEADRAGAAPPASAAAGRIEVRDLRFAHDGGEPVLDGVSFTVEGGQTLALLGPSGSGKTTLINLLLRFYDYDDGSILLDGRELSELPRSFVRSRFGVVAQEPFLYSKTVAENIRLGRSAARDEEMVEAASAACVHESIESFSQGYDTLVGERGITLSGGQRQRVALARALLRDCPVLILDDALSAVDTQTESMIQAALARRRGRQTTLVVAHRLSTLRQADRILVFDRGRIIQSGTHEELAAAEGMYRRLWRIQSSLEEDLDRDLQTAPGNHTE